MSLRHISAGSVLQHAVCKLGLQVTPYCNSHLHGAIQVPLWSGNAQGHSEMMASLPGISAKVLELILKLPSTADPRDLFD